MGRGVELRASHSAAHPCRTSSRMAMTPCFLLAAVPEFELTAASEPIMPLPLRLLFTAAWLGLPLLVPAQSYRNYESPLVHPIRISGDGTRLFAAHTADHRLAVYSLQNPSLPTLVAEIPVGIEPVSVNPRTADEVWVVNHVSDSVSIVSVAARAVIDTILVEDEPSDVVFANGKAFVSAAASDEVRVFDAVTRAFLGTVPIFGKDPRALTVNASGTKVYALVHRSGNQTTIIPATPAPPPPTPTNPSLPAAPEQGLIVSTTDPAWSSQVPYYLPDNDVVEIDTTTLAITRNIIGVGTTNTDLAFHPATGDLWVTNLEARNLVRFEPALRGHAIDSRITRLSAGPPPGMTHFDLNPGLNYGLLPNLPAKAAALAEPHSVVIDGTSGLIYVGALGTDRIGVLDAAGSILARIELNPAAAGSTVATLQKRGPRGLALHAPASRLYSLNRLSGTISVVSTSANSVLAEIPLGTYDPTPPDWKNGRKFLYDAKLSGNGTMSCASCHLDGDMDGLAWDLGDPGGVMEAAPTQPFPFSIGIASFHPMKGAMTTQTLKGLAGTGPLHWRGDRANFQAFNGAFDKLLGGSPLSTTDMNLFAAFATQISYPPNPNQNLDRSLPSTPANANAAAGLVAFNATVATLPFIGAASCNTCHSLPTGTNTRIVTNLILQEPQQMKVPQLRNMYRKTGFDRLTAGPKKAGFGFTHDGAFGTLTTFLAEPVFNTWPSNTKDDIAQFLLAVDTGTAPCVGYQVVVNQSSAALTSTTSNWNLLEARALAGDIDLVALGTQSGESVGYLYQPGSQTYLRDRLASPPATRAQLVALAQSGTLRLILQGVEPGAGARLARDRDQDSVLNADEGITLYGPASPGCLANPLIGASSEPRIGNSLFSISGWNTTPFAAGAFVISPLPDSEVIASITVNVDLYSSPLILPVFADAHGSVTLPFPIPYDLLLVGATLYTQFAFSDPCSPSLLSATQGMGLAIRP